jgi:hypothetical protein
LAAGGSKPLAWQRRGAPQVGLGLNAAPSVLSIALLPQSQAGSSLVDAFIEPDDCSQSS